jgi:hypothetical protein
VNEWGYYSDSIRVYDACGKNTKEIPLQKYLYRKTKIMQVIPIRDLSELPFVYVLKSSTMFPLRYP